MKPIRFILAIYYLSMLMWAVCIIGGFMLLGHLLGEFLTK